MLTTIYFLCFVGNIFWILFESDTKSCVGNMLAVYRQCLWYRRFLGTFVNVCDNVSPTCYQRLSIFSINTLILEFMFVFYFFHIKCDIYNYELQLIANNPNFIPTLLILPPPSPGKEEINNKKHWTINTTKTLILFFRDH